MTSKKTSAQLRDAVQAVFPSVREDLEALVRIPSIGALPEHAEDVRRSAEATAELFRGEGFDVQILQIEGGAPAVVARKPAPEGAPTVLLYAHHDVQPIGDPADWNTDPFVPTEVGDRLYGRGAADDKAGIAAHLAAIRAHGDELPVGVTVLVEGEEEVGSPTLKEFLAEHKELLRADVIVIADSGNWDIGVPALTTSLRGLVDATVEVRTLDHAVHSGMWGGVVPDAVMAMVRLLASLHDDQGNVDVAGLHHGPAADIEYPVDRLRAESGVLDGVDLIGEGSLVERMWTRPAVAVVGMDITSTRNASNTLIPSVKATVSVRLAPGDDPELAMEALREHLEKNAPWGAKVIFTPGHGGSAIQIDATGPVYDAARAAFKEAWDGTEPIDMGVGGSIPFIAAFHQAFPDASVLVTGVEDPDTRAHGANEGLHLAEFERVCLAEALLLNNL
ncbi:MAG TPA: dipeptidase [Nocardioidaceae bacterium]|nr:dipeptidase [Nocardioidaceae bacterium]